MTQSNVRERCLRNLENLFRSMKKLKFLIDDDALFLSVLESFIHWKMLSFGFEYTNYATFS